MTWLVVTEYLCLNSWIVHGFVTRVTRRVSLVEQELPTLPDHLSLPQGFSGVDVARSLVFCVMFCRSSFVLLSFFFWLLCYSVVCQTSVYGFWLQLWHLQTFLQRNSIEMMLNLFPGCLTPCFISKLLGANFSYLRHWQRIKDR
jgi:hypothetical protein